MCRVQERQLSLSYFLGYFPLMVSDAISCPLRNLSTVLVYYHDSLHLRRTGHDDVLRRMQPSLSYFLSYFPLIVLDASSCPLHNLKTL